MFARVALSFRALRRNDFPLLGAWLAEPLVARWWHDDSSPAALERDFGPCIDGSDPAEEFVVALDERPLGLIQRYRIDAYREYFEELSSVLSIPSGALSIDYFIGEPDLRGRGLGSAMLIEFTRLTWSAHPGVQDIIVPVHVENRASWRTLERAGFRRVAEGRLAPDNPIDSREHAIYRLGRPPAA